MRSLTHLLYFQLEITWWWWWWTARVFSALQLGPCRHLCPSVDVIRASATVQQAGPLYPSFIAPPESPRARPPKPARESTLKPAWVGFGHLARQLASQTQQLFLLRSRAGVLSWGRKGIPVQPHAHTHRRQTRGSLLGQRHR